jgi:hypothetical protein
MNVIISVDRDNAKKVAERENADYIEKIKSDLDNLFENKIENPEQVVTAYDLLKTYEAYSGEKYEITIEENTIV